MKVHATLTAAVYDVECVGFVFVRYTDADSE